MRRVYITGVGLTAETCSSYAELSQKNIEEMSCKQVIDDDIDLYEKNIKFHSISSIKREDRSLLNNCAKLSVDSSAEAFSMAEAHYSYTAEEKNSFPVYIANESIENSFDAVENFSHNNRDVSGEICWENVGNIKNLLNPLDMLRLLSTNPLYHVSKHLGLNGGGYPIRRMSLSGLIALEEAFYSVKSRTNQALVVGTGDLKISENLCAFKKMSLLRTSKNHNGIIPSFGSGSIVIEAECEGFNRNIMAELICVKSRYQPGNRITTDDWHELYSNFPLCNKKVDTVICYNNGVNDLANEEYNAMREIFPHAQLIDYKKYYGYTGKANNLIDLITSLADNRVSSDSYVLINGIGMSVGHGYILIRKLTNI